MPSIVVSCMAICLYRAVTSICQSASQQLKFFKSNKLAFNLSFKKKKTKIIETKQKVQ